MAVYNGQVAAGDDDGREPGSGTPILNDASEIIMLAASANTWTAMRFTNVTIPQGSTIAAATLSIYIHSATYDSPDVTVYLEAANNSAALTTATNNISGRAVTSGVVWTAANLGTGWKSPGDLSTPVQEVVDRVSWASGNAMAVLFDARTGDNDLRWRPYEYDTTLAAKLDITYTPPAGSGQPAAARARFVPGMRRPHGQQGW